MESKEQQFDVAIVGAGPAGSATAIELCRAGLSVGIFDSKEFPRRKVCGGCLNQASLALINTLLKESPEKLASFQAMTHPIRNYELSLRGRSFRFRTPPAVAVERSQMDNLLLEHAIELGAKFYPKSTVRLDNSHRDAAEVAFCVNGGPTEKSHALVAASGLATQLGNQRFRHVASADSRVGIETVLDEVPDAYASGLRMVVGKSGYVGLTAINGGRLHVAAAVDRPSLKQTTPASLTSSILEEAKLPSLLEKLTHASWQGTPPLTSHAKTIASDGVFMVGDAAGYVEPFTGEGIRWALHGGVGLGRLLGRQLEDSTEVLTKTWQDWYRKNISRHQRLCRRAAWTLKRPAATWFTLQLLRLQPSLADYFINKLHIKAEI